MVQGLSLGFGRQRGFTLVGKGTGRCFLIMDFLIDILLGRNLQGNIDRGR
jgi:hypothetical protein